MRDGTVNGFCTDKPRGRELAGQQKVGVLGTSCVAHTLRRRLAIAAEDHSENLSAHFGESSPNV